MSTPLVAPTLQAFLESIRDLLSQPDPNNSFWSDAELTRYLNESLRLHLAELSSINEGQAVARVTLDITQNVDTIALPSDFFLARAVFKVLPTQNIILRYFNNLTDSYATSAAGNSQTYIPSYEFEGNNLRLLPPPNFSESGGLLLEYVQLPDMLQDSADQLTAQISALFQSSVEMYAVYKAKLKESLVNNVNVHMVAEANFADLFKQFRELCSKRSKRPTSVVPFDP